MEKTYFVSSMSEAFRLICQDFGPDGSIKLTKEIKSTDADLIVKSGGKKYMVVATDGNELSDNIKEKEDNNSLYTQTAALNAINSIKNQGLLNNNHAGKKSNNTDLERLEKQINELKKLVLSCSNDNLDSDKESDSDKNSFFEKLLENDIKHTVANDLFGSISGNTHPSKLGSLIKEKLRDIVKIEEFDTDNKIYFFMGNPGCGKSTSIVKLGVTLSLAKKYKILNITTDCYKEAGFEQLNTQCHFLGIKTIKCSETDKILNIISDNYDSYDLIFIDTPGVDKDYKNLLDIFPQGISYKKVLVLNANGRYREQIRKISNFHEIGFDSFIFTKLDETFTYGNIINILCENRNINITAVMNGQDTGKDIIINPEQCIDYLASSLVS